MHAVLSIVGLFALATLGGLDGLPFSLARATENTPATLASEVAELVGVYQSGSEKAEGSKTEASGLPIPRFVSLRTEPINLRTGPGLRYPVTWVYNRRRLPVEVIAEFDAWRRIRDPDGTEGWVRQNALIGRRTAMVLGATQALRRSNVNGSEAVANLEAGVIVNIQSCPAGPQCRVEVNGIVGWLNRDQIWGAYPNEVVK